MVIMRSSFFKGFVFKMFSVNKNARPAFSHCSGLKSVFQKLSRFGDGLGWTADLTVEIKLRFRISPASCGRSLRTLYKYCNN